MLKEDEGLAERVLTEEMARKAVLIAFNDWNENVMPYNHDQLLTMIFKQLRKFSVDKA